MAFSECLNFNRWNFSQIGKHVNNSVAIQGSDKYGPWHWRWEIVTLFYTRGRGSQNFGSHAPTTRLTIMCPNDELSWTISWVGYLLKDSDLFILFAENSQILLKISVIPICLTFHLFGSTLSVSKQQTQLIIRLKSSLRHIIVT